MAARLSPDVFDNVNIQWPFRTGVVVPLAIAQKIFGYSLVAYYVFSISFSVAAVLLTYLVMLEVAGQRAAILSSLLFATSALAIYHGTQVLPDTPNLCALLATFYVFIKVKSATGRRNVLLLVLAAACAFYAHLVRMPNAVFLAALPAYEYLTYRSLRRTLWFSAFFAGFIVLECVAYLILTGNPLKRIMLVPKGVTLWIKHQPKLTWSQYLFDPFRRILSFTTGWILLCGLIPGFVVAVRRHNHKLIGLCVGGLVLFLAYSYPVTGFSPLQRALPLQPRYIVGFACVLAMVAGSYSTICVSFRFCSEPCQRP